MGLWGGCLGGLCPYGGFMVSLQWVCCGFLVGLRWILYRFFCGFTMSSFMVFRCRDRVCKNGVLTRFMGVGMCDRRRLVVE